MRKVEDRIASQWQEWPFNDSRTTLYKRWREIQTMNEELDWPSLDDDVPAGTPSPVSRPWGKEQSLESVLKQIGANSVIEAYELELAKLKLSSDKLK